MGDAVTRHKVHADGEPWSVSGLLADCQECNRAFTVEAEAMGLVMAKTAGHTVDEGVDVWWRMGDWVDRELLERATP